MFENELRENLINYELEEKSKLEKVYTINNKKYLNMEDALFDLIDDTNELINAQSIKFENYIKSKDPLYNSYNEIYIVNNILQLKCLFYYLTTECDLLNKDELKESYNNYYNTLLKNNKPIILILINEENNSKLIDLKTYYKNKISFLKNKLEN